MPEEFAGAFKKDMIAIYYLAPEKPGPKTKVISTKQKTEPSLVEFVTIISLMMSLTALSIDAMLPALPLIGADLQVQNDNNRQLVVSAIFLGSGYWTAVLWPVIGQNGAQAGDLCRTDPYICRWIADFRICR